MIRDPNWWANLLAGMGVRHDVAFAFAEPFSSVMGRTIWRGPDDLPNFLGQTLYESAGLRTLDENLNYSVNRLMQVWPRRFPTPDSAQPYAYNPRALANKVYGGRLGNVDADDGWRYHGRGLIQITGRDNYALAQELTGLPLLGMPELLLEPEPALRASAAWWAESIPAAALGDPERVTRYVNGGLIGLAERQRLTALARVLLLDGGGK